MPFNTLLSSLAAQCQCKWYNYMYYCDFVYEHLVRCCVLMLLSPQ
ncbi:hypothetical protein ECTW10119_1893 [Escherichia coli TW10119]|nr:hypothetical protein ECTW10119_1893 [Escherichia coli TW10119]